MPTTSSPRPRSGHRNQLLLVVLAGLLLPAGCTADRVPSQAAPAPLTNLSRLEPGPVRESEIAELLEAHNRAREKAGLPALVVCDELAQAAAQHASDMAGRRHMSHRGSDWSGPAQRIQRVGYSYRMLSENVAAGQRSAAEAMQSWLHSPGHRRNVLGNFSEIGAAGFTSPDGTTYWCVDLGRR